MAGMTVLVVGSGGREYEIARQCGLSQSIGSVLVAPGNAGTADLPQCQNLADVPATSVEAIVKAAKTHHADLVIVGPEAPLVAGLADRLREHKIAVFGPSMAAAQLEASKIFALEFMERHDIPQPAGHVVRTLKSALEAIKGRDPQSYVLKADGLAAGKGVVLPHSAKEAEDVLAAMFDGTSYEGAGRNGVVIQECLHGPEVSTFAVTDGTNYVLLPFSQDHKRLNDGDKGPNTGGVGAYSPLPATMVSDVQAVKINRIIKQTLDGMRAAGTPYQGLLYVGLMLAEERGGDPVVIEYNVRFGDPETEVVLPVLSESGYDVAALFTAAANGDVSALPTPQTAGTTALTICLAANGYPESPRKGDVITGLDKAYENVIVQQAGTRRDEKSRIMTAGGRVLYVTGFGASPDEAAARAYAAIGPKGVHFAGMQYRRDIGFRVRDNA